MGEVLSVLNVSVLLFLGLAIGICIGVAIDEWSWKRNISKGLSLGWWHRLCDLRKSGLYDKYGFLR